MADSDGRPTHDWSMSRVGVPPRLLTIVAASAPPDGMKVIYHAGPCSPAGDHTAPLGLAGAVGTPDGGPPAVAPAAAAAARRA